MKRFKIYFLGPGNDNMKGRLLSPEEGCGYSKVINTRIIGGSEAKNGSYMLIFIP